MLFARVWHNVSCLVVVLFYSKPGIDLYLEWGCHQGDFVLGFGLEVCVFDLLLATVIQFINSMLSPTANPEIMSRTHSGVEVTKY